MSAAPEPGAYQSAGRVSLCGLCGAASSAGGRCFLCAQEEEAIWRAAAVSALAGTAAHFTNAGAAASAAASAADQLTQEWRMRFRRRRPLQPKASQANLAGER